MPFCVKGNIAPDRFLCTVSYWNCHIICEYDEKVKLEFIRANNINESIQEYADFYEVYFNSLDEFANFFNINRGSANRNLFVDFSEIFSKFIPDKSMRKSKI